MIVLANVAHIDDVARVVQKILRRLSPAQQFAELLKRKQRASG